MPANRKLALLFFAAGCGSSEIGPSSTGPHVTGVSHDEISVGQTLYVYGRDFLSPDQGRTKLQFDGEYVLAGSGEVRRAQFSVEPSFDRVLPEGGVLDGDELDYGTYVLRWNRFGPYRVPFGGENRPGVFNGTVTATNYLSDGTTQSDPTPPFVSIAVQPSIVINTFAPLLDLTGDGRPEVAACKSPALRVFGGVPYVLEVEAIGFDPVQVRYEVRDEHGQLETYTHKVGGAVDRLGDPSWTAGEQLVFTPLPNDVDFAYRVITVTATTRDGKAHITALPVPIVRPIQLYTDGVRRLAEYYEPVVVHGPIIGGIATSITYQESHSESRQQGVSIGVSRDFTESQGITRTNDWTEGISVTETESRGTSRDVSESESETATETYGTDYTQTTGTSITYGTTTGTEWGWSRGTTFSGGITIPGINLGGQQANGSSYSTSVGTSQSWGSTTSDSHSQSFSGSYAVGSQTTISNSVRQDSATSESVTYSMGGSESLSGNVSIGESESWNDTWSTTSSDDALLSYSSRVPYGRCAVVYRQTVRFVRIAKLYAHDLCGVRTTVAELDFNEWSWSPGIAFADDCSRSLPRSAQPPAQCFEACD